ncbi:hypothetical protein GGQ97_001194 [Sphingomonas kaistensis]|uniref:Uncharacterized protein n=1 Tax=Sphingomonas kaistensis TaxID=298708 RepID=A0A7X5Y5C8_9SPHN|nr:hypothetical protein [Sphingomonas kaistensis]
MKILDRIRHPAITLQRAFGMPTSPARLRHLVLFRLIGSGTSSGHPFPQLATMPLLRYR